MFLTLGKVKVRQAEGVAGRVRPQRMVRAGIARRRVARQRRGHAAHERDGVRRGRQRASVVVVVERVSKGREKVRVRMRVVGRVVRALLVGVRVSERARLPRVVHVRGHGESLAVALGAFVVFFGPVDAEGDLAGVGRLGHVGRRRRRRHVLVFDVQRRRVFHVDGRAALQQAALALRADDGGILRRKEAGICRTERTT